MSDERFTTDYSDFLKNSETFIKMDGERLTYEEIVDLLNEQQATIEGLKEENDDLRFALRTEQAFTRVEKDKKPFLSKEEFLKELEEDE